MRFDLSTFSIRAKSRDRGYRLYNYLVLVLGSVILLAVIGYVVASGERIRNPFVIFGVIPMMGCLYILVAMLALGRSWATAVEVTDAGVQFIYGSRGTHLWRWTDPKVRLAIDVTQGAPGAPSWGTPIYAAADFHYFRNYLPVEAYNAIIREARAKGMRITETRSPQPGFTRVTITHPARRA